MHIELPALSVPLLTAWPTDLKPLVLRWSRVRQDQNNIELPAAFWPNLGVAEEGRYAVAQFEDVFLFWRATDLGPTQSVTPSGFVQVPKPRNTGHLTYDVAFGEGIAVLAPRAVLDKLAPEAIYRRGFQGFHRNLAGSRFAQQTKQRESLGPLTLDPSDVYGWCDSAVTGDSAIASFGSFVVALCGFTPRAGLDIHVYDGARLLVQSADGFSGDVGLHSSSLGRNSLSLTHAAYPAEVADRVCAIATKKGLVVTAMDGPFKHLCNKANRLPTYASKPQRARWLRIHPHAVCTETGMKLGEFEIEGLSPNKSADQLYQNTAVYPMARSNARLQVHGHWLTRFGFEPGSRYRIEQHPAFTKRLRAVPDPNGRHKVTQYNGVPKLYIPTSVLPWPTAEFVRVIGRVDDGLVIGRSTSAT